MRFSEIERLVADKLEVPLFVLRKPKLGRPRMTSGHLSVKVARELTYTLAAVDGWSRKAIAAQVSRTYQEICRDIVRFRSRITKNPGYAEVLRELIEAGDFDTQYHCSHCGQRLASAP